MPYLYETDGAAIYLASFAMIRAEADLARFTPAYGVGALARAPFGGEDHLMLAAVNVIVWAAVFVGGAAWRMSKDTQRV